MNTLDMIELPPLPQGEYRLSPDSRAPTLYDEEAMEAYALAAIEADRKRRGEPVAWLYEDELPDNYPYDTMFPYSKVDGVRMFPVYAPQPAEPVRVPSEDERAAQGLPPYNPRHPTEEEWSRLTENGRKAWGEKDTEPVRVPSKLSNAEIMSLAYDVGAMPEQMTDGSLLTFARALLARYGQSAPKFGEEL